MLSAWHRIASIRSRRVRADRTGLLSHLAADCDAVATEILAGMGLEDMQRIHGDCHSGNILWRDETAHFVDLDDCVMGPAIQDVWMF